MVVGHVESARAQLDAARGMGQRGHENRAGGDVFFRVGGMLATVTLDEAQLVGQDERLPVLTQRLLPILTNGVHGHGEKSELHAIYLLRWRLDGGAFTTGFAVGARKPVLKSYFRNLVLKLKKCLQNFCA